jgi:hypothetical protein
MVSTFSARESACLNSGIAFSVEILDRFGSRLSRASTSRPERGFSVSRWRLRPLVFSGTKGALVSWALFGDVEFECEMVQVSTFLYVCCGYQLLQVGFGFVDAVF